GAPTPRQARAGGRGGLWPLAALAGLSLLLAFGTPLYGLLFFGVAGVNQLHTPFRWIYPYSLCIAVLAGLGATAIADDGASGPFSPTPFRVKGKPGDSTTKRASSCRTIAVWPRLESSGCLAVAACGLGRIAMLASW